MKEQFDCERPEVHKAPHRFGPGCGWPGCECMEPRQEKDMENEKSIARIRELVNEALADEYRRRRKSNSPPYTSNANNEILLTIAKVMVEETSKGALELVEFEIDDGLETTMCSYLIREVTEHRSEFDIQAKIKQLEASGCYSDES